MDFVNPVPIIQHGTVHNVSATQDTPKITMGNVIKIVSMPLGTASLVSAGQDTILLTESVKNVMSTVYTATLSLLVSALKDTLEHGINVMHAIHLAKLAQLLEPTHAHHAILDLHPTALAPTVVELDNS